MSEICPAYLSSGDCLVKVLSNPRLSSFISKVHLEMVVESWSKDCQGNINACTFKDSSEQKQEVVQQEVKEPTQPAEEPKIEEPVFSTKVSIHKIENPYLVKSDVLIYPTNIALTIDDALLNRMSRGAIQEECDKFQKPIKMGTVYITSNGGVNSKVKPQRIYHATVAGESRLVNEVDLKSAMKKSLLLAEEEQVRNIVIIPADCGTHDINDTARVQLSAIKLYLQTNQSKIKNIFLVMEDEESYKVYEEYYNRIFL